MSYLVALVEHRNVTRAAAAMKVSQPAVTRAIRRLERECGSALFRRTSTGLIPTELAEEMAARSRVVLREIEALTSLAAGVRGVAGRVSVAVTSAPSIEPLVPIIKSLQHRHPGVTVEEVSAENARQVVTQVLSRRCDAGILGHEARPTGKDLVATQLGDAEMMLLLPPDSDLAGTGRVPAPMLRGRRFVVAPPDTLMRGLFDRFSVEVGDLQAAVEVGHREAILPLVVEGIGVSFLPKAWRSLATAAGAHMVGLDPPVRVPLWLVHHQTTSPPVTALVDEALRWAEGLSS